MFVQVIRGKAKDPQALRRQWAEWHERIRPSAAGYLGSTAGLTDDGTFIALVRFDEEVNARANSDTPGQGEWWQRTEQCLEPGASFADSTDVDVWMDGGSDDAGFVQVMSGRVSDRVRYDELERQVIPALSEHRPDVIGGFTVWHDGDRFDQVIYFRSEQEARQGEKKDPPPDVAEKLKESGSLTQSVEFVDLKDPWLAGP